MCIRDSEDRYRNGRTPSIRGYFGNWQLVTIWVSRDRVDYVTPLNSSNETGPASVQAAPPNEFVNFLGKILVTKTRWINSSIQYGMLLQPGRLIFVKIGRQFPNEHQVHKLEALLEPDKGLSVEDLLALDKQNFQLTSVDISQVQVHKTSKNYASPRTGFMGTGAIKIKGHHSEYVEMWPNQHLKEAVELLNQALPGKIIFKH